MSRKGTVGARIAVRVARTKASVFIRDDFRDISDYDQVGRVLRTLTKQGQLIRLGYGVYVKAKKSPLNGEPVPVAPLPVIAKEALQRLGIETLPSRLENAYNAGETTQVPTGRLIGVKGRISRKLGYRGAFVSYERAS